MAERCPCGQAHSLGAASQVSFDLATPISREAIEQMMGAPVIRARPGWGSSDGGHAREREATPPPGREWRTPADEIMAGPIDRLRFAGVDNLDRFVEEWERVARGRNRGRVHLVEHDTVGLLQAGQEVGVGRHFRLGVAGVPPGTSARAVCLFERPDDLASPDRGALLLYSTPESAHQFWVEFKNTVERWDRFEMWRAVDIEGMRFTLRRS